MAVVCVGSVCSSEQADIMSKLLMPQDYGVKLCGREFIRAVIFTCGGSRWRRSTDREFGESRKLSLFLLISLVKTQSKESNLLSSFLTETLQWLTQNEEDNQQSSAHVSELTDVHAPFQSSPSISLTDLLAIYGVVGEMQPQQQQQDISEPNFLEKTQLSKYSVEEVASSLADKWPVSNRKKRNFSQGVAGICCRQGCTKTDIGRLC